MKSIIPILALGALFAASGAAAKSADHNIILSPPPVVTATPMPTVNSGALSVLPQQMIGAPTVNQGALETLPQQTTGTPIGSAGTISPVSPNTVDTQQSFGALPGEPGSATYDPNAALPSLGNEGSALAPDTGTSAAGFNTPSVSSGTNINTGSGG